MLLPIQAALTSIAVCGVMIAADWLDISPSTGSVGGVALLDPPSAAVEAGFRLQLIDDRSHLRTYEGTDAGGQTLHILTRSQGDTEEIILLAVDHPYARDPQGLKVGQSLDQLLSAYPNARRIDHLSTEDTHRYALGAVYQASVDSDSEIISSLLLSLGD